MSKKLKHLYKRIERKNLIIQKNKKQKEIAMMRKRIKFYIKNQ
jgi:hypothetical protein